MRKRLNIFFQGLVLTLLCAYTSLFAQNIESAYAARDKAIAAKAETLAIDAWESAEKSLDKATRYEAEGKSAGKITATYRDAIEEFRTAELDAIETDLLDEPRKELRYADDERAKRYAPETRAYARDQLSAAEAALEADPYDRETIGRLANDAAANARYAKRISLLVQEKPEIETLIRQRDESIRRIATAGGMNLAVDADPAETTVKVEQSVSNIYQNQERLKRDLKDSQAFVAALEDEIRELDQQLGGASDERHQLIMEIEAKARNEEKFLQAELLFEPSEAEVVRQSDTLVLRLFGLEFSPGSSKLEDIHKPLLDKIAQAIAIFPSSTLVVEGHTDSQGSSRMNQRLSQNRSDAVMQYIVMNMQVAPARITSTGYGPEKPIANNETKEGRAKNRRIDLLIKP